MDDEKPDTRHLVLKPKEIVLTEPRSLPGDGNAISAQLIHGQNKLAEERASWRKKRGITPPAPRAEPVLHPAFKPKEITPLDPPAPPGDESAINVADILLENRVAEERSGWGKIRRWGKRKSRRTRDFLIFVGGTDLLIIIVMRTMPNFMSVIYGTAAITLVTSMFAWIIFFVMDDY